jgi:SAM-dependent methyltransferase
MMWFNKADDRALYFDKRDESHPIAPNRGWPNGTTIVVSPDVQGDFTDLPFPDEAFWHVVFDPPHLTNLGASGILAKRYGRLVGDWECTLRAGLEECFRVLKPCGTLIFKWSSTEIPLARVIGLAPVPPLYGHNTGNHAKTHWIAFLKPNRET